MKRFFTADRTALLLLLVAAMSRLIPHWPNFTPLMAIALFSGAVMVSRRSAFFVPIMAMVLSDLALGAILGWEYAFHATQWAVYGSLIGIVALGTLFKGKSISVKTFLGGSAAGIGFFIVTNFAVWLAGGFYPMNLEGLVACYAAGLAFYREGGNFILNGIVSTWLFGGALFLLHSASQKHAHSPELQQ